MLFLLPNNATYPCLSHFIGSNWEKWNLKKNDALWELLKAFPWSNQKVNRDFGAQDYKIEAFEVKTTIFRSGDQETEKSTFGPKSQLSARKVNQSQPGPHDQRRGQTRRHHTKTHARLSHTH